MDSSQHTRDQSGFSVANQCQRSQGDKVMATVFWDARSIIYVDYLENVKTINEDLLDCFNHAVIEKRQDSAHVHHNSGKISCYDTKCSSIHHIHQI